MRKKTLGTLVAGGALLLVGAGLGLRLWANGKADHMPMIAAVHQAPDGRIFIELDDTLYITGQDGGFLDSIPLSRFDASNFTGDFAILSGNSIVLQKGRMPDMTFQDVMKASARGSDPQVYGYDEGGVPLQRCDLKTYQCQTLTGNDGQYFKASGPFRLAVDRTMQRIIVADTDQQRLALLDYSGKILATMGGLNFPNAVQVTGPGKLTVADTNNEKFRNYRYTDDRISAAEGGTDLNDWMGFSIPNLFFPTGFTQTSDGRDWAVIVDATMRHGLAYRWEMKGKHADRLRLPPGADVLSIVSTGDGVLVPDNQHYRIWQFGLDATAGGYFGSYELNQIFQRDATRLHDYQLLYHQSLWWMIALAVPLLFWAARLQRAIEEDPEDEWEPAQETAAPARGYVPTGESMAPDSAAAGMVLPAGRKRSQPTSAVETVESGAGASSTPAWHAGAEIGANGEGEFRLYLFRKAPALGPFVLALSTLMLIAGIGIQGYLLYRAGMNSVQVKGLFVDPLLVTATVLFALSLVLVWCRALLERLYITPQGIRYKSPFSGPLAWLNSLWPSWQLRWDQIAEVKLRRKGYGNFARLWFYVVKDKQGNTRRISALVWWKPGMLDDGRNIRVVRAQMPESLREAIHGSALYQYVKTRGKG